MLSVHLAKGHPAALVAGVGWNSGSPTSQSDPPYPLANNNWWASASYVYPNPQFPSCSFVETELCVRIKDHLNTCSISLPLSWWDGGGGNPPAVLKYLHRRQVHFWSQCKLLVLIESWAFTAVALKIRKALALAISNYSEISAFAFSAFLDFWTFCELFN